MKKLMSLMLGLSLVLGASAFAQDAPKEDTTKTKKAKRTKRSKKAKSTTDTTAAPATK